MSVVREKALWLAELAEAASGTGTAGGVPIPCLACEDPAAAVALRRSGWYRAGWR